MGKDIKQAIRERAASLGFQAVGFARAAPDAARTRRLKDFIDDGRAAGMDWLAREPEKRADPTVLWQDAKTVIALAMSYGPAEGMGAVRCAPDDRGTISLYAQGRDYHDVVKKKLKQLGRWMADAFDADIKVFVDTAPVMEKPLAALAGLGWQGKHTNLVSRELGSWFFLAEIFTTLEIAPDRAEVDHCGSCTACLDACPTGALDANAPYRIDPRKCVSYLTIEEKGPVEDVIAAKMGNRIYGCDDCLAACPWNKYATPVAEPALKPRAELMQPRLVDLAALDDGAFREVFSGSPVKRTGRDRFVRNVAIAMGNSADGTLAGPLAALVDDGSALVSAAAAAALKRLEKAGASS